MDFQGQGRPLSDEGMDQVNETLDVTEPEVWAVLTVETRGFGFLENRRPQILFERHIFHRLTEGDLDRGRRRRSAILRDPLGFPRFTGPLATFLATCCLARVSSPRRRSAKGGDTTGECHKRSVGYSPVREHL